MNYPYLDAFSTLKVVIRWEHDIGEPKRKHKKKRIAKKWLKRYGTWQECDGACHKGRAIYVDGTLYVSRNLYLMLKNYQPKFIPVPHHGNKFKRIRYDI